MHAEFEALHPFLDGNGRLGRMLVPLFLWQHALIQAPMFYISAYFEARRNEYYDGLLAVSRDDDWTGWCRFFVQAVQAQAEDNLARAQGILDLYDHMKSQVIELTRSHHAIRLLDWIFERPIFSPPDLVKATGIPEPAARRFLKRLTKGGSTGGDVERSGPSSKRARVYVLGGYRRGAWCLMFTSGAQGLVRHFDAKVTDK